MLCLALAVGRSINQKRCFQSLGQRKEPHYFFVLTVLLIRERDVPVRVELGELQGVFCAKILNRRFWPFPVSLPFRELNSRFEWRRHVVAKKG
jgi:hypothetical protein